MAADISRRHRRNPPLDGAVLRKKLNGLTSQRRIWPPIDYELIEHRAKGRLRGLVLNAGAGWRDVSHLVDGQLVNQDLRYGVEERTNIHIFSPLHSIPRPDATFDTILCIGVLEHVENPEEIVPEFFRVLKPGGLVVASVPFLQPEHMSPTDFQRYTRDGLDRLFRHHGFEIVEVKSIFTVYHTLHWIVHEWLALRRTLLFRMLRYVLLPLLAWRAQHSSLTSDVLASAFQIVARKPADRTNLSGDYSPS
ncbi:MAG: hypothetical protein C0518_08810 [Opitutus sp.]|nr:hypothetical protein [Opitutus sp.]